MNARVVVIGVGLMLALVASVIWPRLQSSSDPFQVAMRLMADGRPADAAILLDDPLWRGVAEYRAGRFSRAGDAFSASEDETSLYNLGNALAQRERWQDAAKAYEGALTLNPEHKDAEHNLALVIKAAELVEELAEAKRKTFETDSSTIKDELNKEGSTAGQHADGALERPPSETKQTADDSQMAGDATSPGRAAERSAEESAKGATATLTGGDDGDEVRADGTGAALILRESAHEAEILLRQIKDDPARVLRARIRAAHKAREADR